LSRFFLEPRFIVDRRLVGLLIVGRGGILGSRLACLDVGSILHLMEHLKRALVIEVGPAAEIS